MGLHYKCCSVAAGYMIYDWPLFAYTLTSSFVSNLNAHVVLQFAELKN